MLEARLLFGECNNVAALGRRWEVGLQGPSGSAGVAHPDKLWGHIVTMWGMCVRNVMWGRCYNLFQFLTRGWMTQRG